MRCGRPEAPWTYASTSPARVARRPHDSVLEVVRRLCQRRRERRSRRPCSSASASAHKVLSAEPDGVNINAGCGSTHLEQLQEAVVGTGAAFGIAFDGDADRMLAVDHAGELVDGDQLLALFAFDLHERGLLDGGSIVVTVMSNLGLRQALAARGIGVVETPSATATSATPWRPTAS